MIDVIDYLRRLFFAVLVYPAASVFGVLFTLSGFSPTESMLLVNGISDNFAAAEMEQGKLVLEMMVSWGLLAVFFLLMSFSVEPPRFRYALKPNGRHYKVSILQ